MRTIAAVCVQLTGAQMASGNSGKGRATTEESRNFEGLNLLFLSDTTEKQRKKMQFLGPLGYLSLSRD